MNEQNLRVPTSEEAREIGRLGGIASGQARRQRRRLRECLEECLSMTTELDGEEVTNAEAIAASMVREARNGNVRAFCEIRDTCEGKPRNTVEVSTPAIPQSTYDEIERLLMGDDEGMGDDDE